MDDDALQAVIQPRILVIGDYCYRSNLPPLDEHTAPYIECDNDLSISNAAIVLQDNENSSIEYKMLENGLLQCAVEVPKVLHGVIIGRQSSNIRKIEEDTQARIRLPQKRSSSSVFKIEASNAPSIESAKTQLEILIADAVNKCAPTHFISIPLNFPDLKDKFQQFKREVMSNCADAQVSGGGRGVL